MPAIKTYNPENKEDSGIGILDFGKRFVRSAYAPFQNVAADILNPLLPGTPITYIPFGGGDSVTKEEFYNKNKKTNTGIESLTGMEGSPELPSQKPKLMAEPDIRLKPRPTEKDKEAAKKRIEGDKEKSKEDDRPKGLKDYLKELMSDGDALIALGGALARGEGLVGGLEEYSKERKETKALELAAADKLYERERQKKLDEYTIATQQMDIAYKQSQMTTDEKKNAEFAAAAEALSQGIDVNDPNLSSEQISTYYKILDKKMDMIINKEKPMTSEDVIEKLNLQAIQNALGTDATSTGDVGKTYKFIDGKLVAQ